MFLIFVMAVAIIPSLPMSAEIPVSATLVNNPNVNESVAQGVWSGKFLERDWTFELRNAEGTWSGKYMRSDGTKWLPLNDLVVSGRSVAFSIESKPKVRFSLEVDAVKPNMVGTVIVDGIATVPFSALRVS